MINTTAPKIVEVGLGVMIFLKGKILGENLNPIPGGFLDYGESFEECGARETFEETDLILPKGS
ncbi:hypothetical protein BGZ52_008063, partial [Haplosporangium bisporale]